MGVSQTESLDARLSQLEMGSLGLSWGHAWVSPGVAPGRRETSQPSAKDARVSVPQPGRKSLPCSQPRPLPAGL